MTANSPAAIPHSSVEQANLRLRIGEQVVDFGTLRLVGRPDSPRLTSKAAAVLLELARHAGNTVTRDQLFDSVWKDRFPTPDVLTQAIKELRRALVDDSKTPHIIETIPKVGYRLLAPVVVVDDEPITATVEHNGARHHNGNGSANGAHQDSDTATGATKRSRFERSVAVRWTWLVVALGVVLVVAVGLVISRMRVAPSSATAAFRVDNIRVLTSSPGAEHHPHISPDGTRIAYAQLDPASWLERILLRSVEPSRTINLTVGTTGHEALPAWSPDGAQIAFERISSNTCMMFIASSLGGDEREVGACGNAESNYFDWTPDGNHLITAQPTSERPGKLTLLRWDLDSGAQQPLNYQHTPDDQDLEARYSPDGKWIAFRRGIAPYSDLCVMPAAGGAVRQVTHFTSRIRGYTWTSDSRELIFSSNHEGRFALYSAAIDEDRVRDLGVAPAEYPDAARAANTVVYEIPRTRNVLSEVAIGPQSAAPQVLAPSTGSDGSPAISPAGERIVFLSDRSGTQQLWLYDIDDKAAAPLTDFHDASLIAPDWSADGKSLVVTVRRGGGSGLVEVNLASRRQRLISKPGENVLFGIHGADPGSYVLAIGHSTGSDRLVLAHSLPGEAETETVLASGVEHAQIDAPSRLVYYTKTAKPGLFRRPLSGGGGEQRVSLLITAVMLDGWRIVDGRVWYLSGMGVKPVDLREIDPATGKDRLLGRLDVRLDDLNFSVSASRDRIVVAPVGYQDTDVGAFDIVYSAKSDIRG